MKAAEIVKKGRTRRPVKHDVCYQSLTKRLGFHLEPFLLKQVDN